MANSPSQVRFHTSAAASEAASWPKDSPSGAVSVRILAPNSVSALESRVKGSLRWLPA